MLRKSIVERAFELAATGQYRVPSEVRKALFKEGYTQSDAFTLEGRATWAKLRAICIEARYGPAVSGTEHSDKIISGDALAALN